MTDKSTGHVYGGSDEDNQQPAPINGLRGETAASGQDGQDTRVVNGITITEASGVAAAEVSGHLTQSEDE